MRGEHHQGLVEVEPAPERPLEVGDHLHRHGVHHVLVELRLVNPRIESATGEACRVVEIHEFVVAVRGCVVVDDAPPRSGSACPLLDVLLAGQLLEFLVRDLERHSELPPSPQLRVESVDLQAARCQLAVSTLDGRRRTERPRHRGCRVLLVPLEASTMTLPDQPYARTPNPCLGGRRWASERSVGEPAVMRPHLRCPGSSFTGHRFPPEVIAVSVRWYLRYGLSYRDV